MATLILQVILAVLGLAATIFVWWVKNNTDNKKKIEDEDAKIDSVYDSDSVIVELDRLHNEPRTNRP